MSVLITGGAGYIGSHTAVEFLMNKEEICVIDNLSNSSDKAVERVREITGREIRFYEGDLRDCDLLQKIFKENEIDSVIHFAGLKAVGDSVKYPLEYFDNNINSTLCLCRVMAENQVKKIIFSSSATVYGVPESVPVNEDARLTVTNPYGRTKLMIENILRDIYRSDDEWKVGILRYFNPIGAHKSGLIGEDPLGVPNNLLPFIAQVAVGQRDKLMVFGNDYDTVDGTGVRDYIHVQDLAEGHMALFRKLSEIKEPEVYNLGTGRGYSVLEVIRSFERASSKEIPFEITGRRQGDVDSYYADVRKASVKLNWKASRGLDEMCADTWKWQSMNRSGYRE